MTYKPDPDRPWLNHVLPWEKDRADPAQPGDREALRVLMHSAQRAAQESVRLIKENVSPSDDYVAALAALKVALAAYAEWERANKG